MRLCFALTTAALLGSCGTTGGALVTMPFRAGGQEQGGPLTFVTPNGWSVTLTTAQIALGPFYFNAFPPTTQTFRSGVVIIEATEQVIVDALDPTLRDVPGGADGESGHAVAVEIDLFPPDATQPVDVRSRLGGNVGLVSGTATNGAVTLAFSGPITIDTSLVTPTTPLVALQRVRGAAVDLTFTSGPQELELRVDPTHWFDLADFSQLSQGTPVNGVFSWDVQSTFLNALVQGVKRETDVYNFLALGETTSLTLLSARVGHPSASRPYR
jgi:hypothetical protein